MAISDENGVNVSMPVTPMYPAYGGNYGGGFGFGSDWSWIIILLLFGMFGGWGGSGNFGGNNNLYPWLLNNNTQNGFDYAALGGQLSSIQGAITNGTLDNLNRSFDSQTAVTSALYGVNSALQNCCCENRANIADLKYTVATENCADRTVANQNTRDIIDSQTRGTQAILDKLCQLELDGVKGQLDAKNDRIIELQNQLNMAAFKESQTAQNALFAQGLNNEVDALYNRLNNCPVNTVPVYGRQPIFSCGNNGGCGCGVA